MARFTIPRDIYYGRGVLQMLCTLEGRRAMLVAGGGGVAKYGFMDKAEEYLRRTGMEVRLFECGDTDASLELVSAGAKAMREFKPDWIVALGIGACMDAAKLMWVYYEHPEARFSSLLHAEEFPTLRTRARFVAVPSTSGTGTEVSSFAMVADHSGGVSHPLWDYQMTPDIALLDPNLTVTMPPKIVAYMGLDALTHAIEAYTAPRHMPFTDSMALHAIEICFKNLVASCNGDEDAREMMHYAQCMAGIAYSNTGLGLVHAISDKLCALITSARLIHGGVNGLLLPHVIGFNEPAAAERYAQIARHLGLPGDGAPQMADALSLHTAFFLEELGMSTSLRALGVSEAEFKEKKAMIARKAAEDVFARSAIHAAEPAEIELLLVAAYAGKSRGKR